MYRNWELGGFSATLYKPEAILYLRLRVSSDCVQFGPLAFELTPATRKQWPYTLSDSSLKPETSATRPKIRLLAQSLNATSVAGPRPERNDLKGPLKQAGHTRNEEMRGLKP